MEQKRSSFSGKLGFILSAAGSAVGLGNIWRFPYLAAQYGGGIFLLVYIILAVTFGFTLMTAEIAIGRKTGVSAVGAFGALSKKFAFLGYLASIVPVLILPYYCVIGGWITKYLFTFTIGGGSNSAADGYFDSFTSQTGEPLLWFLIFIALTAIVVMLGVEKGVEKVSKFMMPVLVILTVFIAVYTLFMPGAAEGLVYYLKPDFSKLSFTTVLAAMSQLFFSMSLAMGIMITYGSYMKRDVNIESSVRHIEIFDTGIAFFAGLMIIPAVFAFPGGEEGLTKGFSLMFETLPKVFDSMPGGGVIGAVFFLLVLFAALTSSISVMETVVSILMDKLKLKRITASIIVFAFALIVGVAVSLGNGIWSNVKIFGMSLLGFFDFITSSVIMPIVALITCILIGYVVKPQTVIDEVERTGKFKGKKLFTVVIKYIAPICIVAILVFSVMEAFGFIIV